MRYCCHYRSMQHSWARQALFLCVMLCAVCMPGYGTLPEDANPDSSSICYACGSNVFPSAGYGPPRRNGTQCVVCPAQSSYTLFTNSQGDTLYFSSPAVIKPAQTSSTGCVAKFAMIEPASLMHTRAAVTYNYLMQALNSEPISIDECAANCSSLGQACWFFTFQFSGNDGRGYCYWSQYTPPDAA